MIMNPNRVAFSISEVCGISSVGRTTIYSAIKRGDLKTAKVGRRTIITVEALQLWLENLPTSHGTTQAQHGTTSNNGAGHE